MKIVLSTDRDKKLNGKKILNTYTIDKIWEKTMTSVIIIATITTTSTPTTPGHRIERDLLTY